MSTMPPTEVDFLAPPAVQVWQKRALTVGLIAGIAAIAGWVLQADQFYRSFLLGYMLCLGLTIGCLAVLMLYHLTGGKWGLVIRRILEAATRTMPMVILFFVPIVIGARHLYLWSRPEEIAHDPDLQRLSQQYLGMRYFVFRAVLYFVVWGALAYVLNKISERQDRLPEAEMDLRLRKISGAGLVVYGFTITLAVVDWVMSLDPHWASTIYGLIFIGGQGLIAFSFAALILAMLMRCRPMSETVKPEQFLDIGKLILAFVMIWGYFAFSQWLIIWAGNLPEEIRWYVNRTRGGWEHVGLALIVFQFAVPFALLLSRNLKRNYLQLMWVALLLIVMRYVDLFWFIAPNFPNTAGHFHFSWLDAVVPLAMAGLWLAYFFNNLKQRPLLALHDPHVRLFLEQVHEHE